MWLLRMIDECIPLLPFYVRNPRMASNDARACEEAKFWPI